MSDLNEKMAPDEQILTDQLHMLQQKADAYEEWIAKTDWVQEQAGTFPINRLGKHRADVMREEIERLRSALKGK